MVEAYWDIGRQIENAVGERAEYGKGLLKYLAKQLTKESGYPLPGRRQNWCYDSRFARLPYLRR
jgi:hypothetical protein